MNWKMTPWNREMMTPITRIEQEMEQMMKRFWGSGRPSLPIEPFVPHSNVAETAKAYEVTVELPGLKPEDFHVEVKNGELWITGRKEGRE